MPIRKFSSRSSWPWVALFLLPSPLMACEPILPLARLFGGPAWLGQSLLFLALAIGVKCAVFARLQGQLRAREAVFFLLVANLLSTIPGAILAFAATWPGLLFLGLPLAYALSIVPGRRLVAYVTWTREIPSLKPWMIAFSCPVLILVTWVLFGLAQGRLEDHSHAWYWPLKVLYASLSLVISITFSALWEEAIVARLAERRYGESSFLAPVVRANYIALGSVLLVLAIQILPQRLRSPNFLVWLSAWLPGAS